MLTLTRNQQDIFPNKMYNLYKDEIYTDFTFYCAKGEKVKVHGVILIACSDVFLNMLKEWKGEFYFAKLMNSEYIIRKFVDLIYLGSITGSEEELDEVSNLAKIYSIDVTKNNTETSQTALDDIMNDSDDDTPDEFVIEVIDLSSGDDFQK